MKQNPTEVAVGAAVLVAALGFGLYAVQAAGLNDGGSGYNLTASFRSVEGVDVGNHRGMYLSFGLIAVAS